MSPIERKSSIRKAPAADVVEALTRAPETTTTTPIGQDNSKPGGEEATPSKPEAAPKRIGAGRPRGKRRMEPFSSKIEITLRDQLDEYLQTNDMTVVDFLDTAIRDRLSK